MAPFVQMLQTMATGQQVIFEISLINGKLVVTSGDESTGNEYLRQPLVLRDGVRIDPNENPEEWLRRAHEQYTGSYFRMTKPMERGA